MADIKGIYALEQMAQYANKDGIIEIALRRKDKKFKEFQKIMLEDLFQGQNLGSQVKKAIANLNVGVARNVELLNQISELSEIATLMSGINLCATCAGFAIVCSKIDNLSDRITEVLSAIKTTNDLKLHYEFKKCVSDHSIMLDHRKTKDYFSLDKMEKLVAREHDTLEMMVNHFLSDVIDDKGALLCSIVAMASMFAATLIFYDEMYFWQHKENVSEGERWHILHDKWLGIFERIASDDFVKIVQDYGFLEMNLSTHECDVLFTGVKDSLLGYKQDINDAQQLLIMLQDKKKVGDFVLQIDAETKQMIEDMIAQDEELRVVAEKAMQKIGIA